MNKIAILSLALIASPAFATSVCNGTSAHESSVAAGQFITNGFTHKCSSNVFLDFDVSATAVAVGAASSKGKNVFAGTSEGGSVSPLATQCPTTGCTASETAGASSAALAAIAGS